MAGWSAGSFTLTNGDTEHALREAADQGITSSILDADRVELKDGINACLTKNGSNEPTGDLPMGAHKHTNVANGSARSHYAALGQIQDCQAIWCGTAGGTADVITVSNSVITPTYAGNLMIAFLASGSNTTNVTVNVNSLGAKALKKWNAQALVAGDLKAGQLVVAIYDGTQFLMINPVVPMSWTSWTPTISSTLGGSVGSTSTTGSYVVDANKRCSFDLTFTTTVSGGPASGLRFSLPVTAANNYANFLGVSANFIVGNAASTTAVDCYNFDNSGFANGAHTVKIGGSYQAA